ncbi:MAG: hypothetical protein GY862_30285 [Gammaproteobacteria bacterium]|nr:hypothetical protein [Gammaproteobacteria bacterium]
MPDRSGRLVLVRHHSAGSIPGSNGGTADAPQEAIDACSGLTENASCSIQAGTQKLLGNLLLTGRRDNTPPLKKTRNA